MTALLAILLLAQGEAAPLSDAPAEAADAGALVPLEAAADEASSAPADAGSPAEAAPVEATAAVDEPPPSAWSKVVEATGYFDSRTSWTRARTWGFLPTEDVPQVQELVELNTQVKVNVRPRTFAYSDVSLVGSYGGHYRAIQNGQEVVLANHQTAAVQPVVSINELYALHEVVPELNVLLGKKRLVWGSGLAYNPTDFFNARRDPTDPTFQRAGAWLAQVEVPLEVMTFSFVFAPALLGQTSGIPTAFLVYPAWDRKDDEVHYQLAARAYALVGDADVNVMLFYGNRYGDDFGKKLRVGLSFSRYFFTDYELHFETLVQSGSTRDYLEADCVESPLAALACVAQSRSPTTKARLDSAELFPRLLVGTRRQFADESLLSFEYLYQSDGWTKDDFQAFANGLDLLAQGRAAGLPVNRIPGVGGLLGGGSTQDGLPSRLSFDPRGQHYLFATYQKPRIFDDFTAQLIVIANLQDLSTVWTPSVAWSTTEWLTLSLFAFVPAPGPDSLAVKTPAGVPVSEYGTTPFAFRVLFEARAWF